MTWMPYARRGAASATLPLVLAAALLTAAPPGLANEPEAPRPTPTRTGEQLYLAACASCHGPGGRGAPATRTALQIEVPDFTDCSFASREPAADWVGVAHDGGPTRGFDERMPAFGGALTMAELERTISHVRTLCEETGWPPGDLNLPRAMFTEKAFVEDEAVLTIGARVEDRPAFANKLIYETRFGAANQLEIIIPFGFGEPEGGGAWTSGLGDVALGVKRVLAFSGDTGTIFSAAAEIILPTGKVSAGYGKDVVIFEPFLAFGQDIPDIGFLHAQIGAELPVDTAKAGYELFWRLAVGHTFTEGPFGRAWSPMLEVLGATELEDDAVVHWDLAPQLQVTLNTRQHVMLALAVRVPVNDTADRPIQVFAYLLWDWFDGGFFEGW